MISFGKLLVKKSQTRSAQLRLLLDGIATTAVEVPGSDPASLRRDLEKIAAEVLLVADADQVSPQLATAIQLLDTHNRATESAVAAQQKELRCMIAATADTIAAIGTASKDSVDHLQKLESSLESAASADDLRLLRNRLFACLTLVRNESLRVQMESQKLTRSLKSALLKASSQLLPGTDSATGLPGPECVSKSVQEVLEHGQTFSAAIYVLPDLTSWNTRLGRQAGDQILQSASEYLLSQFSPGSSTYRWNGPAFLVTCQGDESVLSEFESKAKLVARAACSFTLVADGKLREVPISFAWIVQRFSQRSDPDQVLRALEECTQNLQKKQ